MFQYKTYIPTASWCELPTWTFWIIYRSGFRPMQQEWILLHFILMLCFLSAPSWLFRLCIPAFCPLLDVQRSGLIWKADTPQWLLPYKWIKKMWGLLVLPGGFKSRTSCGFGFVIGKGKRDNWGFAKRKTQLLKPFNRQRCSGNAWTLNKKAEIHMKWD